MPVNNKVSKAKSGGEQETPVGIIKTTLVKYTSMFKSLGIDAVKVVGGVVVGFALETLIILVVAALWTIDAIWRHRYAFMTLIKTLRAKLQKKEVSQDCVSDRNDVTAGLAVDLSGTAVVVTGAAGGFGAIVSRDLISRGAVVYALDVCSAEATEKAVAVENGSTGKVVPVQCDITKAADIKSITEKVSAETTNAADDSKKPVLYALLNNAGITGQLKTVLEGTPDNMRQVFEVNVFGAVDLSRSLLPHMTKARNVYSGSKTVGQPCRGRIINITSQAGLLSGPFLGNYCGTKFALEAFSDSIRCEMQEYIDVSIVEPFFAATNIVTIKDTDEELQSQYVSDALVKMKRKQAGRVEKEAAGGKANTFMMTPEFVADVIVCAIVDPVPKDRYPVVPHVGIGLVTKLLLHSPNYCKLMDHVKTGTFKPQNFKKLITGKNKTS